MTGGHDGLLLLNKPSGPTSHDVIDLVRRVTGWARVGHAGTLDPLASGLLPIVAGRATRLVRFLPTEPKCYEGSLRLGLTTITDDVTGDVLTRHTGRLPDPETVRIAAKSMEGTSLQQPPAISARKIGGKRLYAINRTGIRVQARPTEVRVDRFDLAEIADRPGLFTFRVSVSSGTYVRGLARDLGATLGCGAALATLHRSSIGPMRPDPALHLRAGGDPGPDDLREQLIPMESMPLVPPELYLEDAEQTVRFCSGGAIRDPGRNGVWRVLAPDGRLLGVGQGRDDTLYPKVVVAPLP